MTYLGDFATSATVHFLWGTNGANGASITRGTNGTVQVYKNNGTTQSTSGVTDTEDFDSLTGVHACTIDLSSDGTFYSAGANFTVVLSGATIDSQSVNGVLAHFSIENRNNKVNAVQISGDTTAADNAEAFFDGTGYAGTGNTIPTVTSVTNGVTVTTVNDKTGYRLSATGVDDVWDEATSGHTTSGTFGQALNIIRAGTAQAGAAGTITLDASASATDDFYNNQIVFLTGGTGALQARVISDYVGSTKVASVNTNWATNPSSDSVFVILPFGLSPASAGLTAADVWSHSTRELTSGANIGTVAANVTQISGDSAAADNAESFFDGTGYAGTNNVIPTVTALTNAPSDSAGVTTLLSRVPSGIFTGMTSLAQWLGLIAGKQTGNSTARTELRATGGGSGTFDETTDSLEASRDNYTAPPSAATVASAVRTELTTELGRVDAAVSTRATPAQVNAEVVDALAVDTYGEPSAPPAATASLKDKIGWNAALARNKVTQTSTTQTLRNDADSGNIATASVSDDGTTFTRAEWS